MSGERRLQQFARVPVPGRVKTRLQREYSPEEACAVHEELMRHTASALQTVDNAAVELWLDSAGEHPLIDDVLAANVEGPYLQSGEDLGERMAFALTTGLQRSGQLVLVGSDCPGIDRAYLESAFAVLESEAIVFGPAEDGGFVLVGCTQEGVDSLAEAFTEVEWGSSKVLEQSLAGLQAQGITASLLTTLYDIDTADDLRRWRREP